MPFFTFVFFFEGKFKWQTWNGNGHWKVVKEQESWKTND